MNFLQQTSLGLSFLWLVGSFAPALASAAKSAPQTFSGAAGQKDPSWIDLATSYGNPYVRDDVDASLSQQQLASWWELYHDDTLTELISLALENNKDLEAARSRLSEARAQVGLAESARLPWINLNGGWMRGNVPDHVVDGVLPEGPVRDQMGIDPQADGSFAGIDASWELDVFGRTKAKVRAASDTLQAQNAKLYEVWVSLSAELALNYITLRTLQAERMVTASHIASEEETLELLQVNRKSGLLSDVPLQQSEYTLYSTRSQLPALDKEIAGTLSRIALLTGTVPGFLDQKLRTPQPLPDIDARLYGAIPADLLRQRPDIHAAERAWAAQIARTDEARAALKPKFSILGLLGFATLGGGLFSAGSQGFSLVPQISYPLFYGGALKKNVAVQKAAEKEKKALYEKMVLKAAGEVRSSMAAIAEDHAAALTLQKGRAASHKAYELVRHNYHSGLGTYLDVLDAQRAYLQADQKYTVSKGKELSSLISLFKALGGGWGPLEEGNGSAVKRHQSALTDGGPYEEKGNEAHERIHQ